MVLTRSQRKQGLSDSSTSRTTNRASRRRRPVRPLIPELPSNDDDMNNNNNKLETGGKSTIRMRRTIPASEPIFGRRQSRTPSETMSRVDVSSSNDDNDSDDDDSSSISLAGENNDEIRLDDQHNNNNNNNNNNLQLNERSISSNWWSVLPLNDGTSHCIWCCSFCFVGLSILMWTVHTTLDKSDDNYVISVFLVYSALIDTLITMFTVLDDYRELLMCTESVVNMAVLSYYLILCTNQTVGLIAGCALATLVSLYFQITRGDDAGEKEWMVRSLVYLPLIVTVGVTYPVIMADERLIVFAGSWILSYFVDVFEVPDKFFLDEMVYTEGTVVLLRFVSVYTLITSRILQLYPTSDGLTTLESELSRMIRSSVPLQAQ